MIEPESLRPAVTRRLLRRAIASAARRAATAVGSSAGPVSP